jgi:hypothetical protein
MRGSMPQLREMLNSQLVLYQTAVGSAALRAKIFAEYRASDPFLRRLDLAAGIQKRFGMAVHPRSIERALGRQEKKRR